MNNAGAQIQVTAIDIELHIKPRFLFATKKVSILFENLFDRKITKPEIQIGKEAINKIEEIGPNCIFCVVKFIRLIV